MDKDTRRTFLFAFSWAFRWYQAFDGWDGTWLVLLMWVLSWKAKKLYERYKENK